MPERPPEASVPAEPRPGGRVAALDLGEVRTGVAVSDPTRSLATPLEVVASGGIDSCLRRLVDEEGVREVVAGVPRTMSGEVGFQAGRALAEIARLREAFPDVEFVEWDERLTTRLVNPAPGRKGKRGSKQRVDHLAAAQMLQEYLDR